MTTLPYIGAVNGALSAAAALPLALAAGGAGLFGAGALASRFSEGKWWKHGLRQLAVGGATTGLSYAAARGFTEIADANLADLTPAVVAAAGVGAVVVAGRGLLRRRAAAQQEGPRHRRQPSSGPSGRDDAGSGPSTGAPPR
ncbi:MAG: hypothetical protein ACRDPW_02730 [Mycobacteriales bacterium]